MERTVKIINPRPSDPTTRKKVGQIFGMDLISDPSIEEGTIRVESSGGREQVF